MARDGTSYVAGDGLPASRYAKRFIGRPSRRGSRSSFDPFERRRAGLERLIGRRRSLIVRTSLGQLGIGGMVTRRTGTPADTIWGGRGERRQSSHKQPLASSNMGETATRGCQEEIDGCVGGCRRLNSKVALLQEDRSLCIIGQVRAACAVETGRGPNKRKSVFLYISTTVPGAGK